MSNKREDINYLIAISCLEEELGRLLNSNEKTVEVIKQIKELERDIEDLKRDRMLSKRKG